MFLLVSLFLSYKVQMVVFNQTNQPDLLSVSCLTHINGLNVHVAVLKSIMFDQKCWHINQTATMHSSYLIGTSSRIVWYLCIVWQMVVQSRHNFHIHISAGDKDIQWSH